MQIFLSILLLLVGFVVLVKGADIFVDGSSNIATALKVPSIIIGLTIVAFGTSAPELAVSVTASISGSNAIAVGNVVGSNIFNLLMVIGISAMFAPVVVNRTILRTDYPICIAATALLGLLALVAHRSLSRIGGIILLVCFAGFVYSTVYRGLRSRRQQPAQAPEQDEKKPSMLKNIILTVVGIAGVVIGGDLVVNAASDIASAFGLSEVLIGLTIVAIGTSLPELVTSIVAARKGECDLAMGNAVGSCIFNILMILGAAATISPITLTLESMIDLAVLLGVTVLVYVFAVTRKKVGKLEGLCMVAMYAAYTTYIIWRNFH